LFYARKTVPDISSSNSCSSTPSGSSQATPTGSNIYTPSGSSHATPTGSHTYAPSGSSQATPTGSHTYAPSGSSQATPTGRYTSRPSGSMSTRIGRTERQIDPKESPATKCFVTMIKHQLTEIVDNHVSKYNKDLLASGTTLEETVIRGIRLQMCKGIAGKIY